MRQLRRPRKSVEPRRLHVAPARRLQPRRAERRSAARAQRPNLGGSSPSTSLLPRWGGRRPCAAPRESRQRRRPAAPPRADRSAPIRAVRITNAPNTSTEPVGADAHPAELIVAADVYLAGDRSVSRDRDDGFTADGGSGTLESDTGTSDARRYADGCVTSRVARAMSATASPRPIAERDRITQRARR